MKPRISHTRTVASEYSERSFNYLQHPLTHRKRNANSIPAVKCHIKHFRLRQLTAPRTFTKTKLNAVTAEKCWNDFFFFGSKTAAKTHIWVRFEFWERFFCLDLNVFYLSVKVLNSSSHGFSLFSVLSLPNMWLRELVVIIKAGWRRGNTRFGQLFLTGLTHGKITVLHGCCCCCCCWLNCL